MVGTALQVRHHIGEHDAAARIALSCHQALDMVFNHRILKLVHFLLLRRSNVQTVKGLVFVNIQGKFHHIQRFCGNLAQFRNAFLGNIGISVDGN